MTEKQRAKKEWIASIRNATNDDIGFLHPCLAYCKKWTYCSETAQCPEDITTLTNIWKAKAIVLNAIV